MMMSAKQEPVSKSEAGASSPNARLTIGGVVDQVDESRHADDGERLDGKLRPGEKFSVPLRRGSEDVGWRPTTENTSAASTDASRPSLTP